MKYKARLVARVFKQLSAWVNLYIPVAKLPFEIFFLAVCNFLNNTVCQLDVLSGLLNGDVKEFSTKGRSFCKLKEKLSIF